MLSAPGFARAAILLLAVLAATPTLAQRSSGSGGARIEAPEAIALRVLSSYRDGRPLPLRAMPLVPRLLDALRRTDIGTDPIAEPDQRISSLVIDIAESIGPKGATVSASFDEGGRRQLLRFVFDLTSGEWLIVDIRPQGRPGLRHILQINR